MAATPALAGELRARGSATWCCGRAASIPRCFIRAASISACRGRCSCRSAASRSKRISRRSSISICPAPRWSSATARRARRWSGNIRTRCFSARGTARNWPKIYAAADVFVFPSRTDTFGLVLLEALASGLPVAAFPVTGPRDVIGTAPVGVLNEDLRAACLEALEIPRQACVDFAAGHTWQAWARVFVDKCVDIRANGRRARRSNLWRKTRISPPDLTLNAQPSPALACGHRVQSRR